MLTGVSVGNMRVFEGDPWHFDLRPLTIFCGTNSSGKSTLLKALLVACEASRASFGSRVKTSTSAIMDRWFPETKQLRS
jgi:predicted ATPase